jgi:hypothetical protein
MKIVGDEQVFCSKQYAGAFISNPQLRIKVKSNCSNCALQQPF